MEIHIVLDETEPPVGRLEVDENDHTAFTGWLDLLGVLSRVVKQQGNEEGSGSP